MPALGVSCHQPCSEINLSPPVKRVDQGGLDHTRIGGEVV
jgi:hypothetical protein